MLPLDDPRWTELAHRGWAGGAWYHLDPHAPFVPEALAALLERPTDLERFRVLAPYLCSEGTAWAAAYGAVPYVVELARRLPPAQRFEHLCFVGLVVMGSCPGRGESFAIKPYLDEAYRRALGDALPLLADTLAEQHDALETRYLLAATAALKGHPRLGEVLEALDCISGRCPRCGEDVYPAGLQRAAGVPDPA